MVNPSSVEALNSLLVYTFLLFLSDAESLLDYRSVRISTWRRVFARIEPALGPTSTMCLHGFQF